MQARTLVDVLLELNIVNLQDIDREVNRLSASLYDPRAAAWFKRVARHWLLNIDWLKRPYETPAVPRSKRLGGRPADYYAEPSSRANILWPSWHGEQPEQKPNVCQQCKGEGFTLAKGSNQPEKCRACKGTGLGEKVNAGGEPCPTCQGSGSLKPSPERGGPMIPGKQDDPGAIKCAKCGGTGIFSACRACGGSGSQDGKKCKVCKGSGKAQYKRPTGGEGVFMPESILRRLLDEAEPEQTGYDPRKRTYTTNLHVQPEIIECPTCEGSGKLDGEECPNCHGNGKTRQRIDKDIQQNFTRFYPKKAKTKRLHGEPPVKKELQPFMKSKEAEEKEFYHFDPIQVRRRDLFNRLQDVVNFLNYSFTLMHKPTELTAEELDDITPEEAKRMTLARQQGIKDAVSLFKQLEVMKPDDVNGFRDILLKTEEFMERVRTDPASFSTQKSGKVLARNGNLVLRRCTDVEATIACGKKRAFNGRETDWCLDNQYNVSGYLKDGPIFFVEKNGLAYVGIHPGSSQYHDPQNNALDNLGATGNKISDEIAPLLVSYPSELPTDRSMRSNADHLADVVDELRRKAGIR